jgi:hypothetical protein
MARRRFLTQPAAWPLADFLPGAAFASTRAAPLNALAEADWSAKFGSPEMFVSLVEWADRIITE